MEIIQTGIKDVGMVELDGGKKSKEKIGEDVLRLIYPILTEAYQNKRIELTEKKEEIRRLEKRVEVVKIEVKPMMVELDREKKVKKLIEKIGLLEKTGMFLSYGNLRREVISILTGLDKLSVEVIDKHSGNIVKILTKKVSK